jgi:hypothetical protein
VRPRVSWAAGRPGLSRRVRLAGAAVAVAALATLIAIGPPSAGTAKAATNSYDQITGIGSTDSAITVRWDHGLLDSSNQPLTNDTTDLAPNADRMAYTAAAAAKATANDPCAAVGTGPLCFMYGGFDNLSVTVSQTQDITQQGINVSWTGGKSTYGAGTIQPADFLQMMECYGDASTGPDPEDCEYGSAGLPETALGYGDLGDRTGYLCASGAVASTQDPPFSQQGDPAYYGCDPNEPGDANPPHVQPTGQAKGTFTIPFVPVNDPSDPAYGQVATSQYYNEFNSDEIQEAVTNSAGDGQLQFETLTGVGAPGLGCGQPEADGSARGCWLVIVPRGQYEPNGYQIAEGITGITTSPLSASNWAQRIQIHLDFAAVPNFCPIGTKETETVGTQVVARAVQSWQIALNTQANCSAIYGYSATTENASTQALANSSSGIGLAFTTIPIGSEAARDGKLSTPLPPILYAPVAVTALGFGFNISQPGGVVTTPMKLSQAVLARALTQDYIWDLPDYYPNPSTGLPEVGPSWVQSNPPNISGDPQFVALNPEIIGQSGTEAPLLTEDESALNQSVWEWIQSDKTTDEWLDGTKIAGAPTVDPDYVSLNLGEAPAADSFPRAYSGVLELNVNTTTALSVSPAPAGTGASGCSPGSTKPVTSCPVTVTATVTALDKTEPVGTLAIYEGSTALESGPLPATGTVTLTTSFSTAGNVPLTATFTPTNDGAYNSSTATVTESVLASIPTSQTQSTATASGTSINRAETEEKASLDLLPYANSLQSAAQSVLTADNTATTFWDPIALSPSGTAGYWDKVGIEQPGHVFMWALSDTPDLAADGLIDAELCDDDGSNCVGPSTASLTTALDSATKDSTGLLEVNPASPGSGGYPLTDVVYAAVPTNQSATALQNYAALIEYAAGAGQTPGVAPGDLPAGYLPLPTSLKNQADLVAEELMAAAGTPTTASPLPTTAGPSTPTPGSPSATSQAIASPTPSSSAYGLKGPAAELVATTTPRQPVGAIRWTLLAVAIVGAACATGGTVLRSARVPRWLHRLRP